METFTKTLRPGTTKTYGGRSFSVFVTVKYDGKRLSITGVEGPLPSGNALGSCGQIDLSLTTLAEGWSRAKLAELRRIWKRWHLNHMTPGTPAQMAHVRANKPMGYDEALASLTSAGLNPDPANGYVYGSAWLVEQVPVEVLDFLRALPEADKTPAWA